MYEDLHFSRGWACHWCNELVDDDAIMLARRGVDHEHGPFHPECADEWVRKVGGRIANRPRARARGEC